MTEIVTLISTQGMPIIVTAVLLIGVIKGIPKFFKWCGIQFEDVKNVFKSYMNEQIEAIKEIKDSNRDILKSNQEIVEMSRSIFRTNEELVGTVIEFTTKVNAISDRTIAIENKVDEVIEEVKTIKNDRYE